MVRHLFLALIVLGAVAAPVSAQALASRLPLYVTASPAELQALTVTLDTPLGSRVVIEGVYLGELSLNTLRPNSIFNPFGPYGSVWSPLSIWSPLSPYGNPLSQQSVWNPLATNPPILIAPIRRE